jgi:signal peptidase I
MLTSRWGIAIVRGRSMLPTLRDGDRLLIRYGRLPRVGEVAVVRFDDVVAIKRLSLRDGDEWWFSRDNSSEGVDSWTRGVASRSDDIRGTAVLRLWPRTGGLR